MTLMQLSEAPCFDEYNIIYIYKLIIWPSGIMTTKVHLVTLIVKLAPIQKKIEMNSLLIYMCNIFCSLCSCITF